MKLTKNSILNHNSTSRAFAIPLLLYKILGESIDYVANKQGERGPEGLAKCQRYGENLCMLKTDPTYSFEYEAISLRVHS